MTGLKRSSYCGDLRIADCGKKVTVFGWVQRQRDLGQLIFIDLRDRTGIVQLALDESTSDKEVFKKAASVKSEYVLGVVGTVRERSAKTGKIATGDIEIAVEELRILGESETPPFEIVPNSPLCHNMFRNGRIVFQLFTDPPNMHVHRANIAAIIIAPDNVQQLLTGVDSVRIADQQLNQIEFLCGELYRNAVLVGVPALRIQGDIASRDPGFVGLPA